MIKKVLLFSFLIIFIPFIIVSLFIRNDEITFNFSNNTMVRVYSEDTKKITSVPLEEYVVGVVSGEMPIEFELEALKAQAVASRSYVMYQIEKNINKEYDVVDTIMNQVYVDNEKLISVWKDNYTTNINKIKKAILETKGEYISYDGKVAEALFFSTSPGITENSEDIFSSNVSYLRSVESPWDKVSPVYESYSSYSLNEFCDSLGISCGNNLKIEIVQRTQTGRVKKIKINNKEFASKYICSKFSLKSTFFEIKQEGEKVLITVKGNGHGVGMSQYGAEGMAKEGYNYEDILKHYYTGIEIKKI